MITWPELIWFALAILIVTMLARLVRRQVDSLGADPANVPAHGHTVILSLDNGRKIYVGREGARTWIQMPSLEQGLTSIEARRLSQALERHAADGLAWETMEKAPIQKAA